MDAQKRTETKVVLPPAAFVDLMFRLQGGTFIDDQNIDLTDLLQDMDFPTGDAGKTAKLEAAEAGNVIVQRGIVAIAGSTQEDLQVLLMHRDPSHVVTSGDSILTSGSPRSEAPSVFAKKVTVNPAPEATDFARIGFAISSPKQTKGIHYLFEIYRARIDAAAQIQSTKDHAALVSAIDAQTAIAGKPLELTILRKVLTKAA